MASIELNINNYDKRFIVSNSAWSNAKLVLDWLDKKIGSDDFDFIGPNTTSNVAVAAMQIGTSFKPNTKVLVINVAKSQRVIDLFAKVKEHASQDIEYTFVNVINGEFMLDDIFDTKCVFLTDTAPKETASVSQLDFIDGSRPPNDSYQGVVKTLSWEKADELLKNSGGPVRRLSMDPNHFIGYNKGKVLEADGFWVLANKKAAERNGGSLNVLPYYTLCDGESVDMSWKPSADDIAANDWIPASYHLTLADFEQTPSGNFKANYLLQPGEINTAGSVMFHLYDALYKKETSEVLILTGDMESGNLLAAILSDMKEKLYNKEAAVTASTLFKLNQLNQVNPNLVTVDFIVPASNVKEKPNVWNKEQLFNNIEQKLIDNPKLSFILNIKGLAEDPILMEQLDKDKLNQYAVELTNYFYNRLKKFSEDYSNNWLILDIDAEANQDTF